MGTIHDKRRRSAGLSLTELIVVLGIIAMVLGLLTPVIGRVRKAGRDAHCKNNLRQLFQGYTIYCSNNSGKKPMVQNRPSLKLSDLPTIADVLESYVDKRNFRCPLDNLNFWETEGTSYEFNVMIYGRMIPDEDPMVEAIRRSADPASAPAFYDYEFFHGKKESGHGKNAIYGDGHVETF